MNRATVSPVAMLDPTAQPLARATSMPVSAHATGPTPDLPIEPASAAVTAPAAAVTPAVRAATAGEAAQAARAARDFAGLHRDLCQIYGDASVTARNRREAREQAQAAAAVAAFEQSVAVRTPAEEALFQAKQAQILAWLDAAQEHRDGQLPGGGSDDSEEDAPNPPRWVLPSMR